MTLLEKIEQNKEDLLNIRHQIHRHPETAFEEIETTKLIKKVLDDAGIENHPNGDSTGVIGLIHGAKEGPVLAIRADIDALPIKENTKKGYKMAYPGDSISLAFAGLNTRRGRVGRKIAHTLTTNSDQGTLEARAVLTPERETVRQNGRRIKSAEEPMFTLTAQDRHGVLFGGRIRRLTPKECLRLQGWRDEQIDRVLPLQSDAQLYKQAGNGVTVTVVEAIGKRLALAHREVNAID